jgi:bacillithiol biosynthesis cysteine-adding enzyme BshC
MSSLSFETLGFSKLFTDFTRNEGLTSLRFPANSHLFTNATPLKNIASANKHRSAIQEAIRSTMRSVSLTADQTSNLERLAQTNALTVITGQQVGFLGGALYTMLKAMSAVQAAQNLTTKHSELQFIPVFWIEDNDHDLDESSVVGILNTQGEAYTLRSAWNSADENARERTSVADIRYDSAVQASIDEAIGTLPSSEFAHEVVELLQQAYTQDTPLTQAFVKVLQYALGETGILFVSAAELRKRGLFKDVVVKELENVGIVQEVVAKASANLTEFGYHAQAQAGSVNLFLHKDGKRHKINAEVSSSVSSSPEIRFTAGDTTFSASELLAHAAEHPENFSPAVLLRPIVQDAIFPNAAYIAGPGEIAYLAQIKELYTFFGILPTSTLARHSATLLDNRAAQFLEKQGVEPLFMFRKYEDVEKDMMKSAENQHVAAALEETRTAIDAAYKRLQPLVAAFDPTLDATTDRTKNQSLQGLDDLAGKIRKAQKRMEETTLGKLRKAHSLMFPMNSLQERTLPYLYFAAKYGRAGMLQAMRTLVAETADKHYVLTLE